MKNIVLIGMPGCGKTTFGKRLARRLSLSFYDADEVLEQRRQKIGNLKQFHVSDHNT